MATEPLDLDLARHYIEIGRPDRALEQLEVATGAALEDPEFWWLQALAQTEREEHDLAAKAAREGLKRAPEDERLLVALAMIELERKNLAAAERAILAALELDPQDPHLLTSYARVVARGGQLDKADALVNEAAKIDPHEPDITRMRAFLAYLRGRDRQAGRHAEELLAVDPEDAAAHRMRGVAMLQQGDMRGASKSLATAVSDDPTDHDLAAVTRQARASLHPLLWPMLPFHRLGVAGSWVAAMVTIFGMRALGLETAAGVAALVWLALVIYSWTIAPVLMKRLGSGGL